MYAHSNQELVVADTQIIESQAAGAY